MFKKILSTVIKEKTQSSATESLEQRLNEIPNVSGKQEIQVSNNKLLKDENSFQAREFKLEDNQFSSQVENLEVHKVDGINTVYYLKDFITLRDEQSINDEIYDLPTNSWVDLTYSNRRLQKWGGDVTQKGLENQKSLPTFLEALSAKLYQSKISPKKPNHVLLNEYQKGVGIMPHTDGPLYFPWVNSISLGSDCIFKFYKDMQSYRDGVEQARVLLEKRSLVIFTDEAYKEYLHTIDDLTSDIVLLQIDQDESSNDLIKVVKSNVLNFSLTNLKKQIESLTLEQALKEDILFKVRDNPDFNYCIEIKRDKRISLTIRYVPECQIAPQN
ncbi:2OG-Fe(II) oxygenase family oxidoreductase (macronuclear) [Tetrahymena thermophila SB210]|uniref:2OG-Fe(II) oxygenase family oxidoreductase n=1 Tax=Tetrahymena thermophila (strain SB210) TaxID=312017 RepID=I7MFE6_TETTS|nr:2OG-Fe(II) oxygenase family oxidoreductase [Tetrahymena thermophila SB210]EAR83837.1 2OG-Fe(II) oxygenase family oxidoreductase [Tetrahymena thermophila SB210]|eukprot:XP_001031500.1 2OG-Fe(II) oxygenase family oxidoreductase [Tetrahymena thermophila SB210]